MAGHDRQKGGRQATSLRRRSPSEGVAPVEAMTTEDWGRFPILAEFIACTAWGDGKPRKSGSLSVFLDDGQLKVALNDKDQGLVAFVVVEGLAGLFQQLESLFAEDRLEWRRSNPGFPKRR